MLIDACVMPHTEMKRSELLLVFSDVFWLIDEDINELMAEADEVGHCGMFYWTGAIITLAADTCFV